MRTKKMKAKANKLLSLILALAMCLSMVQGVAFADDVNQGGKTLVTAEILNKDGDVKLTWSDKSETTEKGAATVKKRTEAKCNANGSVEYTYKNGNVEAATASFPLTDRPAHEFGAEETKVIAEATCTTGGQTQKVKKCKNCNTEENVGDPVNTQAAGHKYGDPTYPETDPRGTLAGDDWRTNIKAVDANGKGTLNDETQPGFFYKVEECSVCEKTETDHYKVTKVAVPAAKLEAGNTVKAVKADDNDYRKAAKAANVVLKTGANVYPGEVALDKDGKVILDDCTKPGKYYEVVFSKVNEGDEDTATVVSYGDEKTEPKHHSGNKIVVTKCDSDKVQFKASINGGTSDWATFAQIQSAEKNNQTVEYETDKDGKIVAKNQNCAKDETYEYEIRCNNYDKCKGVVSSGTETVKKSETHQYVKKIASDTSTCSKDGEITISDVCTVCNQEKGDSKKTQKITAAQHVQIRKGELKVDEIDGDLVPATGAKDQVTQKKENIVEATEHNEGSFDLVTICDLCGEEVSRVKVVVPPTSTEFTWEYFIKWTTRDHAEEFENSNREYDKFEEWRFEEEHRADSYVPKNTIKNNGEPVALVFARPTDSDMSEEAKDACIVYVEDATVTEDKDAATKGDECHMATQTFTAKAPHKYVAKSKKDDNKVNNTKKDEVEAKSITDKFETRQNGYKGHDWDLETRRVTKEATETETGLAIWSHTCKVCGETEDTRREIIPVKEAEKKEEEKKDDEKKEETPAPAPTPVKAKIDISKAVIKGSAAYTGKAFEVPFTVTLNGKKLTEGKDFKLTNGKENNFTGLGKHKVVAEGMGDYTGSAVGYLTIKATKQNIKVTPAKKTLKAKALKKKAASFSVKVKGAKGTVTLKSNSKKVTVKGKKITVKKGTKKGTYKVTVNVAKKGGFKAAKKTITIKVK